MILNDTIILHVRQKRLTGITYAQLCIEFKLSISIVRAICKNIKGRHIALGIECNDYEYRRRAAFGQEAGKTKLTSANVRSIRDLIDQGFPLKQIAGFFSIDISTVSDISTGRSWQHLPQKSDEEIKENLG